LPHLVIELPLTMIVRGVPNSGAQALDDLAGHLDVDQLALARLTKDHKEGVAAFLERRKPRFRGR
jgi:enoyl-CoA hydratase